MHFYKCIINRVVLREIILYVRALIEIVNYGHHSELIMFQASAGC